MNIYIVTKPIIYLSISMCIVSDTYITLIKNRCGYNEMYLNNN